MSKSAVAVHLLTCYYFEKLKNYVSTLLHINLPVGVFTVKNIRECKALMDLISTRIPEHGSTFFKTNLLST